MHNKQRNQAKKILKQKLVNYQNQLKIQADIIIYQGQNTAKSQHLDPFTWLKNSVQIVKIKNKRQSNYQQFLEGQTNQKNPPSPKKSLTRQNIHAINKKAKVIKSNLYQMAKKRTSHQNLVNHFYTPPVSTNLSPLSPQKSPRMKDFQNQQRFLRNLLTIKKSKQQQHQLPYDYIRRSVSQQLSRAKKQTYQTENNMRKPKTALKKRSFSTFSRNSHLSPRPSSSIIAQQPPLAQYFTPCYHKQTKSGYIINQFQPKIKAKHFQDNLKVMATLIKKKVNNLQGIEVLEYMRKIGDKKNYYTPNNDIQQAVKKSNLLNKKNIQETKLMKTRKQTAATIKSAGTMKTADSLKPPHHKKRMSLY